jgi:hypothetical protein
MFINKAEIDGGDNAFVFATAGFNINGRQFLYFNTGDPSSQRYIMAANTWLTLSADLAAGGALRTSRDYISMRILSASAVRISRNNNQSAADQTLTNWDTSPAASVPFLFGPSNESNNRLSFMSYFTAAIDNTTDAAFYSLYKQTLGQGLTGLP